MTATRYRRDTRGRFTASRAPIDPDNSVYQHVSSPSADPQRQHDEPGTVYAHDFARGPVHRLIPHRQAVEVEDADHPVYGCQGAGLRAAARDSGPMDPTPYLVGLAREEDGNV